MKICSNVLIAGIFAVVLGSAAHAQVYNQGFADRQADAHTSAAYNDRSASFENTRRAATSSVILPERSLCGLELDTECSQ